MDHLSSCYFCGTALDDPLQEYPIVPEEFRTDDVTTATLCPTCHQKLETVLDAVVDAATDGDTTSLSVSDDAGETPAESPLEMGATIDSTKQSEPAEDSSTAAGTEDDITADDVASMAGDIDVSTGDDETEGEQDPFESGTDPNVSEEFDAGEEAVADHEHDDEESVAEDDEREESVTTSDLEELAGDIDASIGEDDGDDGGDDADDADAEDAETGLEDAMSPDVPDELQSGGENPDTVEAPDEDPLAGGSVDVDADEAETDAPEPTAARTDSDETDGTDGAGDADGETDQSAARPSISALEYNKVMRLLQNRQFPVERDEIETVAANAYDLSHSECAEVIDLAVDRGLIGESGSQLIRPE